MNWMERVTKALEELVELQELQQTPHQTLSTQQAQKKAVLSGVRCPRCGMLVYPYFPQPIFCQHCTQEVRARDLEEQPQGVWFLEYGNRIAARAIPRDR